MVIEVPWGKELDVISKLYPRDFEYYCPEHTKGFIESVGLEPDPSYSLGPKGGVNDEK